MEKLFIRLESREGVVMKYKVIIHEAEEGGYWAEVPSLPGCFSQGESLEEVKVNIKQAIEVYLESQEIDFKNLGKTTRVNRTRLRHEDLLGCRHLAQLLAGRDARIDTGFALC